uniref:U1756i n=1 Tax=Mycobacterium leprae TaxID=1769 RepID=Q49951_MYCLR|nr:u1756i [Mycobacterium leprae]
MIYTAHPLFGERERAALDADGARWRRTDLVVLHLRHSSDNLSDQPRLASLVLDSDAPKQLDEVAAAKQTLRLSDLHTGLTTNPLERCNASQTPKPGCTTVANQRPGKSEAGTPVRCQTTPTPQHCRHRI